ncbi:MAG: hypothetical protein HKN11_15340 [Rhizobiales bacterium]|nr:hypothetical protein [Hyphomicrobiales bacterium]
MFRSRVLCCTLLLAAFTTNAIAKPAGKAVGVNQVARIVKGSNIGKMAVGQGIFVGDRIATKANGQVQIQFNDKTRLVIGPSSTLVIRKYVAAGQSRARSFSVRAFAGVFRFISGNSAKPSYEITTSTGTIGVRGTRFDFGVLRRGRTNVILFNGAVRLCGTAGSCRTIDKLCQIAGTDSRGNARLSGEPGFRPARGDLRRSFPYVRSQRGLQPAFRVTTAPRCRDVIAEDPGVDTNGGNGGSGGDGGNR